MKLLLHTIARDYTLTASPGETLIECFARHGIPGMSVLVVDADGTVLTLGSILPSKGEVHAYALRNNEYEIFRRMPSIPDLPQSGVAVDIVSVGEDAMQPTLLTLTRQQAMRFVLHSVSEALDRFFKAAGTSAQAGEFQVALSPGGDGRVLAEALAMYRRANPAVSFHCVVCAVGFEDETEHCSVGRALAEEFGHPCTVLGVDDAARRLGYKRNLNSLSKEFMEKFEDDEPEVMLTYWVQEVNLTVCRESGRRGVLMGYNKEDLLAERLYHVIASSALKPYPARIVDGIAVLAPLFLVPKRLLDSMDVANSLRNYRLRRPSRNYLRSSLYALAYEIAERHPLLASAMVEGTMVVEREQSIAEWVARLKNE